MVTVAPGGTDAPLRSGSAAAPATVYVAWPVTPCTSAVAAWAFALVSLALTKQRQMRERNLEGQIVFMRIRLQRKNLTAGGQNDLGAKSCADLTLFQGRLRCGLQDLQLRLEFGLSFGGHAVNKEYSIEVIDLMLHGTAQEPAGAKGIFFTF